MASDAQIQAESWWQREIVTVELDWLADELCRRTGQPRVAAGTKGNTAHLSGAHRSQEWILNSDFAASRRYTVQAGLTALQARHVAGLDFTPGVWGTSRNRQLMREQTGRLLAAMKAGQLNEVRELYGTTDGRTVTGWNNVENRTATSDDSHLDHFHLSIDRRHCGNKALMERILAVALGEDTDMNELQDKRLHAIDARMAGVVSGKTEIVTAWSDANPTGKEPVVPNVKLAALEQKVAAFGTALAGVDEAIAATLRAEFDEIDAAAAATLAAVEQVPAETLDALGAVEDPAVIADRLRAALGDKAAAVGAILAQG